MKNCTFKELLKLSNKFFKFLNYVEMSENLGNSLKTGHWNNTRFYFNYNALSKYIMYKGIEVHIYEAGMYVEDNDFQNDVDECDLSEDWYFNYVLMNGLDKTLEILLVKMSGNYNLIDITYQDFIDLTSEL